ncbi:MAG: peptide chain release factor 2 [Candidatus Izemoplasmataceae bacterium]
MEIYEIKDVLQSLQTRLNNIENLLDLDQLNETIKRLENQTYEQGFWDDHEEAQKVIEVLKQHKSKQSRYTELKDLLENLEISLELLELGENVDDLDKTVMQTTKKFDQFETTLYLKEDYDHFNAIIEIHPGAGGTESQDWAMMLFRMIKRYAEDQQYGVALNDYQDGQEAGIKSVTFTVSGSYAYGYLKAENGVHRLVRISPFDASGRRHTSFASVNVIPELDDSIKVEINENDLKIDTYRSSGAGGQSVNTTDSAVRITHIPTKVTVTCQNERSQIKNREKAMQILKGKLYQLQLEAQNEAKSQFKVSQSNAFGSQIRSYVMHPYSMVKDHRTGYETGNVDKVLDGDLEGFIQAFLRYNAGEIT